MKTILLTAIITMAFYASINVHAQTFTTTTTTFIDPSGATMVCVTYYKTTFCS